MTHNIMQMIVLSTGHLQWSTVQLLEVTPVLSERYPVLGAPIPYGFPRLRPRRPAGGHP